MSLKVTIEVNGRSEQQLAPVISQVLGRHSRRLEAQENNAEPTQIHSVYSDQSALLQQQVQQLISQNQMLQVQLSQSQRLLAGTPAAKALLPSASAEQSARSPAAANVTVSHSAEVRKSKPTVPPLPAQYQTGRSPLVLGRIQRSLVKLPVRLWRSLIRLSFGQEGLLVFLLLCGGLYGTWVIAAKVTEPLRATPKFVESEFVEPEFVESADEGPGNTAASENGAGKAEENSEKPAPTQTPLASPTSKAGSHPPPPPAFEEP